VKFEIFQLALFFFKDNFQFVPLSFHDHGIAGLDYPINNLEQVISQSCQ